MRPEILNVFFRPASYLKNVGPKTNSLFEKLCGGRLFDVVTHLPRDVRQRHFVNQPREALGHDHAVFPVTVLRHVPPPRRNLPWRVLCQTADEKNGENIDLIFFHANADYLRQNLKQGGHFLIGGKVTLYQNHLTLSHPDIIIDQKNASSLKQFFPLYRLTKGLHPKTFSKIVSACLDLLPELPEWIDQKLLNEKGWKSFHDSLFLLHHPEDMRVMELRHPLRMRLAYDECLAHQFMLAALQLHHQKTKGRVLSGQGKLRQTILKALPFSPTAAQNQAIEDILKDMRGEHAMLRLLQGDVGSGKTLVALFAMVNAVEAGTQACLMSPSEILAQQHFQFFDRWLSPTGIKIGFLSGSIKGKARKETLEKIADGYFSILIGTHALFQQTVIWKDLSTIVIDEQHRFGVEQRLALYKKGQSPDILMMSATPIPRSLTLTLWGDIEVSQLKEKPAGRKPIATRILPISRLGEVIEALRRSLSEGKKIYWICPLVEKSEKSDAVAVEERAKTLSKHLGAHHVAFIHGQMSGQEKEKIMHSFTHGDKNILVATTVIEVGVDVPAASRMVIEEAHLFGLAQLHQLRGRIGRGSEESVCLLLYKGDLSDTARQRLDIIRNSEDGFMIAEEDLRLRGGGDRLGTRQSGMPLFHFVDLLHHRDLMGHARDQARDILNQDPFLQSEKGKALRLLLYLFECDQALDILHSG